MITEGAIMARAEIELRQFLPSRWVIAFARWVEREAEANLLAQAKALIAEHAGMEEAERLAGSWAKVLGPDATARRVTGAEVDALKLALFECLGDMGAAGHTVAEVSKARARVALEPFLVGGPLGDELGYKLYQARAELAGAVIGHE